MSVALFVKYKNNNKDSIYQPIATEAYFNRWLDGAERLELQWTEIFSDPGAWVPKENLPEVIGEFKKLQSWFESEFQKHLDLKSRSPKNSAIGTRIFKWLTSPFLVEHDYVSTYQHCRERNALLIETLERLVDDDEAEEIYIG